MAKEVVLTAVNNRIEYATTNGKGMITGKRDDITDVSIEAVFMHLKSDFERLNKDGKGFGKKFGEEGRLMYLPKGVEIVWAKPEQED